MRRLCLGKGQHLEKLEEEIARERHSCHHQSDKETVNLQRVPCELAPTRGITIG